MGVGHRFAHPIASFLSSPSHSQKPATRSLALALGASITRRLAPSNAMHLPCDEGLIRLTDRLQPNHCQRANKREQPVVDLILKAKLHQQTVF